MSLMLYKESFLFSSVFLFFLTNGMHNNNGKNEMIIISQESKNNNVENMVNQFETVKKTSFKGNNNSSFIEDFKLNPNKKNNFNQKNNNKKEKHQSDSSHKSNSSIDFNVDFSDMPSPEKDVKIENIDQLKNYLDDKIEQEIRYGFDILSQDLGAILLKFLTDIHKTQQSTEAKIANLDDYVNAVSTKIDMHNKIFSNKMQGINDSFDSIFNCFSAFLEKKKFKTTIKDLQNFHQTSQEKMVKFTQAEEKSKKSSKNKKISPKKNISQKDNNKRKSRFSFIEDSCNPLYDNRSESPDENAEIKFLKELDNSNTKSVNDNIGGSIYISKGKSQSAENLNKRKSLSITRKNSEELSSNNDIKIGVITPQKINKKQSEKSIISQDSSLTLNATSEFPDDEDKVLSGRSLKSSGSNQTNKTH